MNMDTALEQGDWKIGNRGLPFLIQGEEELFQRAWICLTIPKGNFPYLSGLGSSLREAEDPAQAVEAAREALKFCPEAEVLSARTEKEFVRVRLEFPGGEYTVEVKRDT